MWKKIFKIGDLVQHVSGGPKMTVEATDSPNDRYYCIYWSERRGEYVRCNFQSSFLVDYSE